MYCGRLVKSKNMSVFQLDWCPLTLFNFAQLQNKGGRVEPCRPFVWSSKFWLYSSGANAELTSIFMNSPCLLVLTTRIVVPVLGVITPEAWVSANQ